MDLISDVMRHADPLQRQLATQRLESLAKAKLAKVQVASVDRPFMAKDQPRLTAIAANAEAKSAASSREAMKQLDAVLATKLVESMMPKGQSSLYGSGTSGEVWRGFHIETMGKALAEGGLLHTGIDALARVQRRAIKPFSG